MVKHLYINSILHGLARVTEIAMHPLTEIMKDCRIDTNKEKYEEKILNCFENASLISNLAQFTDQIQTVSGKSPEISDLGKHILQTLIDINPFISEIVERNKARTTVWKTEDGLLKYINGCIAPPLRSAIKNLFLATFK